MPVTGGGSTHVGGAPPSTANPVPVETPSVIDANNTTTDTLAGDATFTGDWTDVIGYVQVVVCFSADVNGVAYFESSADGMSISGSPVQLNNDATFAIREFTPTLRYCRVRFVNGASAQGSFALTTRLNRTWGTVTNSAIQSVSDYSRVVLVRAVTDPFLDEVLGRQVDLWAVGTGPTGGSAMSADMDIVLVDA